MNILLIVYLLLMLAVGAYCQGDIIDYECEKRHCQLTTISAHVPQP